MQKYIPTESLPPAKSSSRAGVLPAAKPNVAQISAVASMRPRKRMIGALALCAVAVFGLDTARAGTITKAGTGTDLTAGASWVGGVTPTAADVAGWTGTSLGSGLTLGADTDWLGLNVSGALTDIGISGAGTLTLGGSGVDMSSSGVNLSIANPIVLGADQTWKVSTGKTLTSSGVISGGSGLSFGEFSSATYSAAFLPASPTTVLMFPATSLASIRSVAGLVGGLAIPTHTGQAAPVYYFTNDGTTATFQMQIADSGYAKGVKVQLTQSGADIYGTVLYAAYYVGSLGSDFDTAPGVNNSGPGGVATSAGVYAYGCASVTISTFTSATYSAAFLPPSPTNVLMFPGTSLASVSSVAGLVGGKAIPISTGQVASVYYFINDGTNATFQMQIADSGYAKGVKVQLTQSGADIYGTVLYAAYYAGSLGSDFDTAPGVNNGGPAWVATSPSVYLYGCASLTINMGTAPAGGTLNISGANTYSGGTTISSGTVQVGAGGASGSLGTGAVADYAALVFDLSGSPAITNGISGYGTLTQAGSGTLTLSGPNTYSGGTTISAGTLAIGDAGHLGGGAYAGAIKISSKANFVYSSSQDQTISGTISGAGTLTQNGPGQLTLAAANSFTGGTTVNHGTLVLNNGVGSGVNIHILADNSSLTVADGSVSLETHYAYFATSGGTLTIQNGGGVIANNSGTGAYDNQYWLNNLVMQGGTLSANYNGNSAYGNFSLNGGSVIATNAVGTQSTISAVIALAANTTFNVAGDSPLLVLGSIIEPSAGRTLTKTGAGTMTLANANSYTGATTISNGTLQVTGSLATGPVTVCAGGTLSGNGTINGLTTIQAGGKVELVATNISTCAINSTLSLAGNAVFNISKTGGAPASDNINGLTGVTYGGTLTLANITSDGTPLAAGDTFTLFSLNSGSYGGAFTAFNLPPLPTGLSWSIFSLPVNGQISVVQTPATVPTPIFTPAAGAYVGTVSVDIISSIGSTIFYTTDGSTPTASSPSGLSPVGLIVPANTNVTIKAFATKAGSANSAVASATYVTISIPTWINPHGGSWAAATNWSNNVVGNGSGVSADFSTLTLPANSIVTLDSGLFTIGQMVFGDRGNTHTWEIDPGSGGPLTLDAGTNTPTITVNNTTTILTVPLAGTAGLTKSGSGALTLSGVNTFTGTTTIGAGTLTIGDPGQLGGGAYAGAITDNGNFVYSSSLDQTISGLISGAGTLTMFGPGKLTLTRVNTFTGDATVNGGTIFANGPNAIPGPLGNGNVTVNSGGTIVTGGDNSFGRSSNPASHVITINAGGEITTSTSSTCHLEPLVLNGGTLNATSPNTSYGSWNFDYGVSTPGTGNTSTISGGNAALTEAGGTVFNIGSGDTLNVSTALEHLTGGAYGDTGVIKTGAGTLTLAGANTYTSGTTVNNGTLQVTGSIGVSAVTVYSGATLRGNGTINGPTTIASGGTVELVANNISTLAINSTLKLAGKAVFNISKTGGAPASDNINGLTGVTYGGTLTVTNITGAGTPLAAGDTFTLFTLASGNYSGGFAAFNLPPLASGVSWDVSELSQHGWIKVVNYASTPVFNPPAGIYVSTQPLSVTISSLTAGATIYYTTNGSTPTTSSPVYSSPIILPLDTTNLMIQALATATGQGNSAVVSATYSTEAKAVWISSVTPGSWSSGSNWTNGIVPNNPGAMADFSTLTLATDMDVTLDGVWTVGNLIFGDAGNLYRWELDAGNSGVLTLAATDTPTITVNNQITTITAPVGGINGFIKTGVGTLVLGGDNSYSGGTTISQGTLEISNVTSFGAGPITLGDAHTGTNAVQLTLDPVSTTGGLTLSPVNVSSNGTGPATISLTQVGRLIGYFDLNLNRPTTINGTNLTVAGLAYPITGNVGTLTINGGSSGTGLGVITGFPGGPYTLNPFTGTIVIASGIVSTYPNAFGVANPVVMQSGSTWLLGDFLLATTTIGSLNGSGIIEVVAQGGASSFGQTLSIGNDNGSGIYSGVIADGANVMTLIKTGTGTQTLADANTYTGTTTVSGGTLLVNGSIDGNTMTVQTGATLGGDGTINGPVTVNAGGRLEAGTESVVGTLTIANTLSLNAGSTTMLRLDKAAVMHDSLAGISTLTYGGTLTVTNFAGTLAAGDTFQLFNAANYTGNFAAMNLPALGSGLVWNWTPANGTLSVVPAPTPPVLSGIAKLSSTSFSLSFSGSSGQSYAVLMTTNLALPLAGWTPLTNGVFGASPVDFTDTGATNAHRYYRIVSP